MSYAQKNAKAYNPIPWYGEDTVSWSGDVGYSICACQITRVGMVVRELCNDKADTRIPTATLCTITIANSVDHGT
jgi:hypothetical protein